jgi:hypothetical protein
MDSIAAITDLEDGRNTMLATPQSKLAAIVTDAYRIFGGYKLGKTLNVCSCNVCLADAAEAELLKTPLRAISSKLLAKYTDAVSGGTHSARADEFRYFLPRYLELIAADDPPDDMGFDICLRRFRDWPSWRTDWPREQVECLDQFYDAYLVASLRHTAVSQSATYCGLRFNLGDILSMIVTAGGDITRVLQTWDAAADPDAAIHMAALRSDVRRDPTRLINAHLSQEYTTAAEAIGAFLSRTEVDERLERVFFGIKDPALQKIVSDAMWI